MIHLSAARNSEPRGIFFGWYMVVASVLTNTIFSAAYFQGFGVLILPIERAFGWDRWVISAAMSLRQLESGIVSPAVGFLLDRFSARKLIFWSAVISGFGFIGLGFTAGIATFFLCFVIISLGASGVSHAVTWPVIISRGVKDRSRSPDVGLQENNWTFSAGPWIFAGLKLGVIIGLATLLGAEMFASRSGLGFEVAVTLTRFDFARGYAAMFAAALVVYVLWLCLNSIELALSRKITFGFDKAARAS